jgi:carbonic anhydrase/acetyltransferase-like protein (isoleucine patch superfamily)
MLSRRLCSSATAATAVGVTSATRTYYNAAPDPIGKAHPDLMFGSAMKAYRGRGWLGAMKQLPAEALMMHGGDTLTTLSDRHGAVQDPEDPRHPIVRAQLGPESKGLDGSVHPLVNANWGPIPQAARLLQVLYNNYLEPISMHRPHVPLMNLSKLPNNGIDLWRSTVAYCGQTSSAIGNVFVGMGAVIMEGVTMRADTNQIYIHEGCQIMENVCMIADAPTTLHHYQRQEAFNPYQTLEVSEGVIKIGMNSVVECNCMIESCSLGTFNRIGHGTKILKGVTSSAFCHVMPGSVVLADTHMSEGEVWGGAPARKLGKVSKFEYKKPWFPSVHHRDMTVEVLNTNSNYGDQVVLWAELQDQLEDLMVHFEEGLTDGVKAQIREFIEGREPFNHTVARITQGWSPANRPDDKIYDHKVPCIIWNSYRNHNDDADSEYSGTIFNWRGYITGAERRY